MSVLRMRVVGWIDLTRSDRIGENCFMEIPIHVGTNERARASEQQVDDRCELNDQNR
jgi:hypothetical protein